MIDTVKLTLNVHPTIFLDNKNFDGFSTKYLQQNGSFRKVVINMKSTEYLPRLTIYMRSENGANFYSLCVEFSAPKLLFGNNFEEISDADFENLLKTLQDKLFKVTGYTFTIQSLRTAKVSVCHYSKNFVFRDYTSCSTVLDAISKQDISAIYDLRLTAYNPGHALQLHTNSLDIAFYDKVEELQRVNISPKRGVEPHSFKQKKLLEQLTSQKPFDVLRYEVRLAKRTKIKRLLPELAPWDFQSLFSSKVAKEVLCSHWNPIAKNSDLLSLDSCKPMEVLQNYLIENPSASLNDALRATAGILIVHEAGHRPLKQLANKAGGTHVWYRLKPLLHQPNGHRYKAFQTISNELQTFKPIHIPP